MGKLKLRVINSLFFVTIINNEGGNNMLIEKTIDQEDVLFSYDVDNTSSKKTICVSHNKLMIELYSKEGNSKLNKVTCYNLSNLVSVSRLRQSSANAITIPLILIISSFIVLFLGLINQSEVAYMIAGLIGLLGILLLIANTTTSTEKISLVIKNETIYLPIHSLSNEERDELYKTLCMMI